jgi:proteic killer suppression protein
MPIQSFRNSQTRALHEEERAPKGIPTDLIRVARRKLRLLDSAVVLADLLHPAGNRLEALKGDRRGRHSIRVNDQFRLCFIWTPAGPAEVEFVDYHR